MKNLLLVSFMFVFTIGLLSSFEYVPAGSLPIPIEVSSDLIYSIDSDGEGMCVYTLEEMEAVMEMKVEFAADCGAQCYEVTQSGSMYHYTFSDLCGSTSYSSSSEAYHQMITSGGNECLVEQE
jgi:hypothetical protein